MVTFSAHTLSINWTMGLINNKLKRRYERRQSSRELKGGNNAWIGSIYIAQNFQMSLKDESFYSKLIKDI